jgi:hypothetical protein
MPACPKCGTELIAQVDVCFTCGTVLMEKVAKPAAARRCPACGKSYPDDYADAFCTCGIELPTTLVRIGNPAALVQAPPPGTRCVVLYGPNRQPQRYFPLSKDVTLIGRLDAVQGCFPDIDVDSCVEPATARKVSRRHALVLHSRATDTFSLRPLGGNTGTQIEADMVPALVDYPLVAGTRFVLAGAVRFKFEIV